MLNGLEGRERRVEASGAAVYLGRTRPPVWFAFEPPTAFFPGFGRSGRRRMKEGQGTAGPLWLPDLAAWVYTPSPRGRATASQSID